MSTTTGTSSGSPARAPRRSRASPSIRPAGRSGSRPVPTNPNWGDALDNGPMDRATSEAIAETLVGLGYSARSYFTKPWGYRVVIYGRHGAGPGFRYVITDAAQLPKALDDLAA